MGLYPYTYSAGLTVSTAVAKKIKTEGKPAVDRWLGVVKSGGTKKPLDVIKQPGVDMSKPDAIKEAVAYVGSLVDELEKSYRYSFIAERALTRYKYRPCGMGNLSSLTRSFYSMMFTILEYIGVKSDSYDGPALHPNFFLCIPFTH